MAKKYFTAPVAPGSLRSSENRIYTHAIVGQHDYAAQIAFHKQLKVSDNDRSNWEYYTKRKAHLESGQPIGKYESIESYQRAKEIVDTYGTVEAWHQAYQDKELAELLEKQAAYLAKGEPYGVCAWSMSLANAQKAMGTFAAYRFNKNVKVVEAVECDKKGQPLAAPKTQEA